MAAGVAHELNNPLAIIAGYLQIMELEYVDSNTAENIEQRKMITSMIRATERATKIVDHLKSLSRDASMDSFESASFNDIIHGAVNLLENRFERHQVKFNLRPLAQDKRLNCRKTELSLIIFQYAFECLRSITKRH